VTDVAASRQSLTVDHFAAPEAFRDYFKARYGPTIAVYGGIAADPERVAALDGELADLAERHVGLVKTLGPTVVANVGPTNRWSGG